MRRCIATVVVWVCGYELCAAIIIRDDKEDAAYVVDASTYPAVFAYPLSQAKGANCAATLIDDTHAITAAHCFSDGSPRPPFDVQIGNITHRVSAAYVNPCFDFNADGPNGADLAILVLSSASGVTPYARYASQDEQGKTMTILGWGDTGPAAESQPPSDNGGQLLRRGANVVESTEGNVLRYTMNSPADGALPLEAMGWSGDSGGPAFIELDGTTYIAGVNSGGDCCRYGSTDQFARLSSAASRTWIDESISRGAAAAFAIPGGADHASCNSQTVASAAASAAPAVYAFSLVAFMLACSGLPGRS